MMRFYHFQSKKVGKGRLCFNPLEIQRLLALSLAFLFLSCFFYCQNLLASQEAVVVSDSAIIYADKQMSAPVGYVAKGKRIRIGSVPRNRAQVYPIVVSGKIAYIRSLDISPLSDISTPQRLVTERFSRQTRKITSTSYSVSYFSFLSQVSLGKQNDDLKDGDAVLWNGIAMRGGAMINPGTDLELLFNVMNAAVKQESFNAVEFGIGVSQRALDLGKFALKIEGQALAIPFSNYAFADDFRVNGYGYSLGGGLRARYLFTKHVGFEIYGGFFYTKMSSFAPPEPYNEISPTFVGSRVGLGLSYDL